MFALASLAGGTGALAFSLPVPLSVLVAWQGLPAGLAAGGLFLAAWAWLAERGLGLAGAAVALGVGLLYGVSLRGRQAPGKTILAGAGMMLAGLFLRLPALGELWRAYRAGLGAQIEATMQFYHQSGLLEAMAQQGIGGERLRSSLESLVTFLGRLFPALIVWEVLLGAAAVYFLSRWLAGRRITVPALPPFLHWQVPWPFAWGVIAGLASFLLGDWRANELLVTVGQNILVGHLPLLWLGGLAVLGYLYRHLALPPPVKAAAVFALFFYPPLGLLVLALAGLFDPLLNLRRLAAGADGGGENR